MTIALHFLPENSSEYSYKATMDPTGLSVLTSFSHFVIVSVRKIKS